MSAATGCPDWCAIHIDETATDDGFTHRREWRLDGLPVISLEEVHSQDGSLIERNLNITECVDMLSVADCRTLSALFLEAADYLEARGIDSETHDPVRLQEMSA